VQIKPPKNFSPKVASLTPQIVRLIREGSRAGLPAVHFARVYKVSAETIRKVVRYETWGWVPDGDEPMTPSMGANYLETMENQFHRNVTGLTPEFIKESGERLLKEFEGMKTQPEKPNPLNEASDKMKEDYKRLTGKDWK
jgi:hypothetical protein